MADAGGIHNKCCYMADKVTTTADISSKRGNETFRYIGDPGEDFLRSGWPAYILTAGHLRREFATLAAAAVAKETLGAKR